MKDISITNYLGPGTYLLCNYPQQFGVLIAERGYKIYHCDDINTINQYITSYKINHILIYDKENNLNQFISLFKQFSNYQIDNIVIETIVNTNQKYIFFDFIENAYKNHYVKKSSFYAINKLYDPSFRNSQHLNIVLSYSAATASFKSNDEENETHSFRIISNITPYIRPGDQVAIISNLQVKYSRYLGEQTKANDINNFALDDITDYIINNKRYHFIIIDGYDCFQIENTLSELTKLLLPAGRLVIISPSIQIINALEEFNITPEVFFERIRGDFVANIYQGEAISVSPEICVFMKSPLESTDYPYQETIYGYSQPPENLLAFERDYNNPWIIRGIVEFPFRNCSPWNLKKYCIEILEQYNSLTPDYAAALAVLGYQVMSGEDDSENIVEKISAYCTNIKTLEPPTAHQIRWFISLSTLLGLIHNKNNNKLDALINFSHAANVNVNKFSPSIGTKVLQSLYFKSIILLSLNKKTCAEITIDRALKRGISLLSQKPEEFIGKFSHPFNFVMYIYHDIIDWIIKLINIKNAILSKKFYIKYIDDAKTWSSLLLERMDAINEMSQMINDRDITIQSQKQLIDEHNNTILMQGNSINNQEDVIHEQEKLIEEIEQTLKQQNQLINEHNNTILTQKNSINNQEHVIHKQEKFIEEIEQKLKQQNQLINEHNNTILTQKNSINNQEHVIHEQEKFIEEIEQKLKQQNQLINEHNNTILTQKNSINNQEHVIHEQEKFIEEIEQTLKQQNQLINEHNNTILTQKNSINNQEIVIREQEKFIEEIEQTQKQQNQLINEHNKTILMQKNSINNQENVIREQEKSIEEIEQTLKQQNQLIDEHNNTILMQKNSINNQEHVIHEQKKYIEEIEQTLKQQNQLINTIKLNELENNNIISGLKEKEQHLIQSGNQTEKELNLLTKELEKQKAILCKIYNLPVVGFFIRKLATK